MDRAIDQWRPEFGADIRTYSKSKILKAQSEAISTVDPIRVPKSAQEQRAKLSKTTAELGGSATVCQLSENTNIRQKRIEELQSISQPISLNILIGAGNTELLDLQADSTDATLAIELESALEHLAPREQRILRLRFLGGYTFQEIGDFFSLTNQRIQQIYKAALERLRGWLVGEKPDELGRSQEPPVLTQPIPAPTLWQHLVFAKLVLATKFCQIFEVFTHGLKCSSQKQETPCNSESLDVQTPTARPTHSDPVVVPHRNNSGGLRDGPKYFLDTYRRIFNGGLSQFFWYWPGSSRGSDQPRCRGGDFHRCKGQVDGCPQKDKLISRIYCNAFLISFYAKLRSKTQLKTKFSNNIVSFSRHRNNSNECLLESR